LALLGGGDLSLAEELACARVDAASAWMRLWASAPITIIQHVLSIEVSFEWTSGGQF
jgi:hypothetical protein